MDSQGKLPYRPCVGAIVLNGLGEVFVGRRANMDPMDFAWQFPQGGIDQGEDAESAVFRELEEETSMRSLALIARSSEWLTYDFPEEMLGKWEKVYRGQKQKWFVFRFLGKEAEINLNVHQPAELCEWKWVPLKEVADIVIPFKRPVYKKLINEFLPLARPV